MVSTLKKKTIEICTRARTFVHTNEMNKTINNDNRMGHTERKTVISSCVVSRARELPLSFIYSLRFRMKIQREGE